MPFIYSPHNSHHLEKFQVCLKIHFVSMTHNNAFYISKQHNLYSETEVVYEKTTSNVSLIEWKCKYDPG